MQTTEGRKRTRLLRHIDGQTSEQWDALAEESPLEIIATHHHPKTRLKVEEPIAITMRTPGADRELALGLVTAEQLIDDPSAIDTIETDYGDNHRLILHLKHPPLRSLENRQRGLYASASCGVCGKATLSQVELPSKPDLKPMTPHLDVATLSLLPQTLRLHQGNFEETGGLHAAALFDQSGNLYSIFEDIGRHNALDKLIGYTLENNPQSLTESILLLSGRVSFELIQKAAIAQIPIIAALGAPTSLAVELADRFGQTLIGFLRKDRFNLYSHPQRIHSHE